MPPARPAAPPADAARRRVVKSFDFDEAPLGNFESTPRLWRQVDRPGFPRYVEAAFDRNVGHAAPPSYRLPLGVGDTAADYLARDMPVHPQSDYRVRAWIRTEGLEHAAASLSAYYLNADMQPIERTERRSAAVRDSTGAAQWTEVVIDLPGGVPGATWIALSCRVEQDRLAGATPSGPRPIRRRDVAGGAWFDDITVLRMPRLALELSTPGASPAGNVFAADEPIEYRALVSDPDGEGLEVRLELIDWSGDVVFARPVPINGNPANREPLTDVPAGPYVARLDAMTPGFNLARVERRFIRLGTANSRASATPGRFGVILDDQAQSHQVLTQRLLELLNPGHVKVPFWRRDLDDKAVVFGDRRRQTLMESCQSRGIEWVAVLSAPPESLAGPKELTLLDVLAGPAHLWRPYLALPAARLGNRVRQWQVGADFETTVKFDERLDKALRGVREELLPMIGRPTLAATRSALVDHARPADADVVSVTIPAHIHASTLADQVALAPDRGRTWLVLEDLDEARYARDARLAESTQRLICALATGSEAVFTTAPWRIAAPSDAVPSELFAALHTLQSHIGPLDRARPIWVGHGLRAWLFTRGTEEQGVLVAWAAGDGPSPARAVAPLGGAARRIDIWGQVSPIATSREAATAVDVSATPTLFSPVDRRAVEMQGDFTLDDPRLQPSLNPNQRRLRLGNASTAIVRGQLRLRPPASWRVWPDRMSIHVEPGGTFETDVFFHVPSNQPTGAAVLIGRLSLEGEDGRIIELQTPIEVRTGGLEVTVLPCRAGDALEIVQRITNRTDQTVSLVGEAVIPGRRRIAQRISGLGAGQTAVRRYQIEKPQELSGERIRVSVEQIDGPMLHNDLVNVE